MSLIGMIVVLIVIGVLSFLANTQLAEYMDAKYLKLLNILVFVVVLLWVLFWLLSFFGLSGYLETPMVFHR